MKPVIVSWLLSLPCVIDRRVVIDVRGMWPTALIGLKGARIQTRDNFISFITDNL